MPPAQRSDAQALPAPGQVIAGKYAIVRVLGEGGMGVVFEATHVKLRQRVAVKMLQPEMLTHEVIVKRFEREARAAAQLRNRHVARVMDVDVTDKGLPYMVMEFLEGQDLQAELDNRGRLGVEEAVDYVLQACSAMIEAHQLGIVHRDLKPANLFLTMDDESRIVKVLDFGISKLQNEEENKKLTEAESVIGTAMYMSPEQLRHSGSVDARTDIWALGVILYELLAGRTPWVGTPTQLAAAIASEDAPDIRTHAPVPAEVAAVVMKALRRNPAERFSDVRQLAFALAAFAPPHGAGRILADGLLNSSSGAFPRVSLRPRLEDANTVVQAAAVSESRSNGGREVSGTTPGWSQQQTPATRSRTVLIGFLVAFAVGLLVVGGIAMAWLRWQKNAAPDRATAAQTASTPAMPPASVPGEPLPSQADPPPPVTGQGASPAVPEPAVAPRPHVPAAPPRGGAATTHPTTLPAAKPAPPGAAARPPAAPASVNPLTL